MTKGPYQSKYSPVQWAANALNNQAETIASELHHSIDRAHAIRARMIERAAEKAAVAHSKALAKIIIGYGPAPHSGVEFL